MKVIMGVESLIKDEWGVYKEAKVKLDQSLLGVPADQWWTVSVDYGEDGSNGFLAIGSNGQGIISKRLGNLFTENEIVTMTIRQMLEYYASIEMQDNK